MVPDAELHFSFARAGGPGGQNVNKVASKAVLHWDLAGSPSLPEEVKARLRTLQRRRITGDGVLVLQGQRFRDQARNVADCRERLREMIVQALQAPRPRKATRPTRGSRERRLNAKKHQAQRKSLRRAPPGES
jgi:ribosome-associated protein